ncbi:MAG: ABC transporter permease subunit [Deltaproteobacteria bacterium]|nr:ABC transporter permease subunit [Deltaproteobacteria bacterium]
MDLLLDNLPLYGRALLTTLSLMLCALACGLALAVPIGLASVEGPKWLRALTVIHMTFFRGTPLLAQIFIIYFGCGQAPIVRSTFLWTAFKDPFFCAVLALALNTSAYTANIIKGAVLSVPKSEIEAGTAFGLSRPRLYLSVIMPYALRLFMPAYGSEVIIIMKATSLASTVTMLDLTGLARNIMSRSFRPFEAFAITAAIYVFMALILTRIFKLVEKRLSPGDAKAKKRAPALAGLDKPPY